VTLPIRMVRVKGSDPDVYARHVVAHMAESGREGAPHFAISRAFGREEVRDNLLMRLLRELHEPLWGRAWMLLDEQERAVGHLELRGGRVPAELHRATLGMGILAPYRRAGHGRRLVETAVAWARQEKLAWIDLGVFAGNVPARRLYASMGFRELGTRLDAFRLEAGVAVDDVMMALAL
jgi:GNAT superfamily N-acetyltransferase